MTDENYRNPYSPPPCIHNSQLYRLRPLKTTVITNLVEDSCHDIIRDFMTIYCINPSRPALHDTWWTHALAHPQTPTMPPYGIYESTELYPPDTASTV